MSNHVKAEELKEQIRARAERCIEESATAPIKAWHDFIQGLEVYKLQGMIKDYRISDPENHIVEIQPYFPVWPIWEIELGKETGSTKQKLALSKRDLRYMDIFCIDRLELLKNLLAMRKGLCAYTGPPCDCKYGATKETVGKGHESGCGCPEIANACCILARMTDEEYKEILGRELNE